MTLQLLDVRDGVSGVSYGYIPVGSPGTRDYYIKSIEGLGPVDAVLAMSNFADYDGAVHHGGRLAQRNIVLTLGYSPNYSNGKDIGVLRRQAYSWFRPKALTRIIFTDSAIAERVDVRAYVEKITPVMFSKDPEVQVSLICEDPYFAEILLKTINGVANTSIDLSTYGDAPTGFNLEITPLVNFSVFVIRNFVNDPLGFTYPFAAGDSIKLGFHPGNKYAVVTRGGVTSPLFDRISSGSMQMMIDNRVSDFRITTNGGAQLNYTLTMFPKWLGL